MKRSRWVLVLLVIGLIAASCGRSGSDDGAATTTTAGGTPSTAAAGQEGCDKEPLQATDVGVSADSITVEVMADTGSALAPGLFQGNIDALKAYATYINAKGGVGCRQLVVKTWDSKLSPDEARNGLIDACANAVAMVGSNSLFNPDVKTLVDCKDKAGNPTGLPDLAALANDINQQCNPTTFMIQAVSEKCPITTGQPRPLTLNTGLQKYLLKQTPGLHGVFLVPGDLPTTVQSATFIIKSQEKTGIKFDAVAKVSGRDEQSAFTPKVQALKAANANYLYDGSNDRAMINMRKEARAQGVTSIKIWACSLACYTRNMLTAGGSDVEGTYVWMQFIPFEEADQNDELKAYVDSVGPDKIDSFGANGWQAATTFKQVIDKIVKTDGPNAITRKSILSTLQSIGEVDANGWMGKKDLHGLSPCYLIMQIKGGKFVRVYPTKPGSMDCDPSNITTVTLDPAAEAAKIK